MQLSKKQSKSSKHKFINRKAVTYVAASFLSMKYENTHTAKFIERLNRFVARVELDGCVETVHVKNTGRCRELLVPGAQVILAEGSNPARKTKYDLISVRKEPLGWVNIDSQIPNTVVKEWLEGTEAQKPEPFLHLKRIQPEYNYGASRMDFYLETEQKKILMEAKGCTLERNGIGYFPDAPTERGIKHLHELTNAVGKGYEAYLAFVIAMPGITEVRPNMETHPEFGYALEEAKRFGVHVLYLTCDVEKEKIRISGWKWG